MFSHTPKRKKRRLESRAERYRQSLGEYPIDARRPAGDLPALHERLDEDDVSDVEEAVDAGEWREGDEAGVDVDRWPADEAAPSDVLPAPLVPEPAPVEDQEIEEDDVSFGDFMCCLQAKGSVTMTAMTEIISYMVRNKGEIIQGLESGSINTYYRMRTEAESRLPCVYLNVNVTMAPVDGGGEETWTRLRKFPKKRLERTGAQLNYTLYYVETSELIAYHERLHGLRYSCNEIDMSVDGIPETKSGGLSVDVLSIRFTNCRMVYSQAILQPARKAMGIPDNVILEAFLRGLQTCGLRLRRVIADAPKRAGLQGIKQHSSKFACPYCVAKKSGKVFKSGSMYADERTDADLRRLGAEVEAHQPRTEEELDACAGVKRLSPLASVEGLDLVMDIPAESMHLVHLGIVRKFIGLCYLTAQSRSRDSEVSRVQDGELNAILLRSKGLSRFSRRLRRLDQANYKSEEFRNLVLVYWPAVMDTLPPEAVKCWLTLVFVVRALYLPDGLLPEGLLEEAFAKAGSWYRLFEQTFGPECCSYNVHIFGSHLDKVRIHGPLSEASATIYEGHYERIKRAYRGGTMATGTQALKNVLLAMRNGHNCGIRNTLSLRKTSKTDDTLVYVRDGRILRLTGLLEADVTGFVVPVESAYVPFPNLNFSRVLAFKQRLIGESEAAVTVPREEIVGQVVECHGFLSVLTWNMLTA